MTKKPRIIVTMPDWLNDEVERLRREKPEFRCLSKSKVLAILTWRGLEATAKKEAEKLYAQDDH